MLQYKSSKGFFKKLKDNTPYFDSAVKWYRVFGMDSTFWKQIRLSLKSRSLGNSALFFFIYPSVSKVKCLLI